MLSLAAGLPVVVGGLVTWGPQGHAVLAVVLSLLTGIVLTLWAVGLAIDDHPWQAMRAVVMLPPTLLFFFPVLILGKRLFPEVAYGMVVVGSLLIARAVVKQTTAMRERSGRAMVERTA
jgi:ABC-type dipeptide/oligopeptide/nickel transport system permease subunit